MNAWASRMSFTLFACLLPLVAPCPRARCSEENLAEESKQERVSLTTAIRAVNEQAAKYRVIKHDPLTEQQVLDAIDKLAQLDGLSDEHFKALKNISATRTLPERVSLRQFLRYDDHSFMQHGWWVKLILERDSGGAFGVWIRQDASFTRPYTQRERQFREAVRRARGLPLLNRLVTYFEDDPKFNATAGLSADYQELVSSARTAIDKQSADDFLERFHWEGVDGATREFIEREVKQLVSRKIQIITVEKKRFQGELAQWQAFTRYGPNLPIEGYIDFIYATREEYEPISLRLEMGEHKGTPKFVCHVVKDDLAKDRIGKRMSGPLSVRGFLSQLPDGWLELGWTIEAPNELPALQQANLELWRRPISPQ